MSRDTILFDINETVLDLSSLKPRFQAVFGSDLVMPVWFATLLHTSTVCALTDVKSDFATLAGAAVDIVAGRFDISVSDDQRREILSGFQSLAPHADVKPALERLRAAGYQTVAFTNSSHDLVTRQLTNAGLVDLFDERISVEPTGNFKPAPNVYRFVSEQVGRPVEALRLIAAHDWDIHGALTSGLLGAYVARSGAPYHPLYRKPQIIGDDMVAVVEAIIEADKR
ncbi:MAG: haloacid dehalogenase type II [Alphaproteobacteria bacterium]|nr:haloacid dehalogenase type II [Alphaproteobacteria bacterium]